MSVFVYKGKGEEAPRDATKVVVDPSIKVIGARACFKSQRGGVERGAPAIGGSVFRGCSSLERITFPSTLSAIDNHAFSNCNKLEVVEFNEGLELSFWKSPLAHVNIPSSVREICWGDFSHCQRLKSVNLPIGLKVVGKSAFGSCSSLEHVEIPPSLEDFDDAFSSSGLKSVSFGKGLETISTGAFRYCKSLEHVEVPSFIKSIGISSFHYCRSLKSVDLNEGLQVIGEGAFRFFAHLWDVLVFLLLDIGGSAFHSCKRLNAVNLGEGTKKIGCMAFSGCVSLEGIEIPSSVSLIGDAAAFNNCHRLKEVELSEGISRILSQAFMGCGSIEGIKIPSSVHTICDVAFLNCYRLKSFHLVDGLRMIGNQSFWNCNLLILMNIPSTVIMSINANAFHGCSSLRNIVISPHCDEYAIARSLNNIHCEDWCSFEALKSRFDKLPIHKMCNLPIAHRSTPVTLRNFTDEVVENDATSESLRDCIGMTPLHVLACSTTNHDITFYQFFVDKNPEHLIAEDQLGETQIYYAIL
ncbi:LOW QUALITY PROTEIN: hypothetical protein ACHAWF_008398, partial [Thalassiosira exigua]